MTDTTTGTAIDTVRSFLGALEAMDIDRALLYAADDIVYQNVPLPPARGRKAFERQMRFMARFGDGFEARLHNIAADGSAVLTERTDVLKSGPFEASFWVCGTFEVRDGQIVLWRDYFDWVTVGAAMVRGAVRAVFRALRGD
ncbi:MAG: limonene-1,2-epoxide hydrolase family protein [Acidimicrobiales bacterium]